MPDQKRIEFDVSEPVWGRCFTVAPLVLVGTRDEDGALDLAPKHMATPMGWQNYFGFVCSPQHHTYSNIERTGQFTVSYPKPSQVLYASLAASPRETDGPKTVLQNFNTFAASEIDGEFIDDAYLFFECRHFKTVDGFGSNCLITGEIVAAYADSEFVRGTEHDDQELIHDAPLFAYLAPGRFATISRSNAFPFPVDMKR
ncbi:MAG: flavin reductase [Gammaproteobacteria bacterium]|nr:flavin reductase [Gammaproteobacteria bacterium]MDH4315724.1 flavin reductase [Gammaproteobacteria bacterium]MDH5213442.1 flavin reductase [Gammaproteobacteria bacterium]